MKKILLLTTALLCGGMLYSQLPGSGEALSFDGTDDQVDLGTSFTYQNFTVDMWVKPGASQVIYADIIDNTHTDYQNWVCQRNVDTTNRYHFGCAKITGGTVSSFSLIPNVWQHLTLVKSATALETYVNGILSQSAPWDGLINYSDQHLRLGSWGFGGRNWNGSIDEVRIWNTALSQSQIRERMCRKITSADPLYNNLVVYYNFDESTGNTVVDGTLHAANGTLENGTARIISGAAIGNASTYNYVSSGLPAANLHFNGQDNLSVIYDVGTYTGEAGTHLYVVNGKPNIENGFKALGSNDRYFGVFNVSLDTPAYTAIYNYTGNASVTNSNETGIRLFKRTNNSAVAWSNAKAIQNLTANTLTLTGQNTEYILGLSCGDSANISAAGPLSFCRGDSIILTSSAAASYLWSNGAITQSIIVKNAGTYSVTITDTAGCSTVSNPVSVAANFCPSHSGSKWQRSFGGNGDDRAYFIQPTSDGGYIVAGESSSSDADFIGNHGGFDYRIVKLDSVGNIIWQKNYGGSGDDIAKCIRQTSDGGYIVVGTSTSADGDVADGGGIRGGWVPAGWVLKLDNTGAKSWDRVLQGWHWERHSIDDSPAPCSINTVIETTDGGYLVGGDIEYSDWTGSGGPADMVAKLNSNGQGDIKFSGRYMWSTITSIVGTSTGYTATGNHNNGDIYVVNFNRSLLYISDFDYGGSLEDKATSIQQTADGGYIVAGTSSSTDGNLSVSDNHGDADYWLLKLNNAYEVQWSKCFGGSGADIANALQQMADGSYYIAGTSFSTDGQVTGHSSNDLLAQPDAWLIRIDTAGNLIWGKCYGGNNPDESNSLQQTADGGLIMAGASASPIPGSINSGNEDYWVLKLAKTAVADGIPGSCTSFPPITINSSNNNQWVLIKDSDGNAVAEIKANGNNLGIVTASVFINSGAVRKDKNNKYYLDRNISLTSQVKPLTAVDIRLYIKAVEYNALKNAVNKKGQPTVIDSIDDVKIFTANINCSPDVTALGNAVATAAENWEADYILSTKVGSFSSFFFAAKTTCAAPVISNMLISRDTLWPPNHCMKNVSVAYRVSNDCKCNPVTRWLTVKSNEPVCGIPGGDKSPDWVIADANHLQLRAERNPQGNGRVYTITINAKNAAGFISTYDFNVVVPVNMSASKAKELAAKETPDIALTDDVETVFDCVVTPNPSSEYFNLQVNTPLNEKIEIAVMDMSGRLMERFTTAGDKSTQFGNNLKPGIYMVQVIQGAHQKIIKLVKK